MVASYQAYLYHRQPVGSVSIHDLANKDERREPMGMQGSTRPNVTKPVLCTRGGSPPKIGPKPELKAHEDARTNPVFDLPPITELDNRRNHSHMAAVKIEFPKFPHSPEQHEPMEIGLIRDASTVIRGRNNYSEDSHSQRRHIPSFQEKCRMLRERLDLLEANSRMEIQRHRSRSTKSANPTHAIYRGHQPVWKMGHLRLKPLERLGKGASGVVFSAKYIQMSQQKEICESKEVAVKVIPLWQRPGFMREVEFMKALGPIGVSANLFATVETERSLILIMSKGDISLYDRVISLPPERRTLGQEECKRIIKDLVLLVDEMHNQGFIHFDLKPDNILIKPDGELVLCDGSLAATVAETRVEKYFMRGTPGYMAPEVVNADPIMNPLAAYMYAVGAILAFLRDHEPQKPLSSYQVSCLVEQAFPYEHYQLANDVLGGLLRDQPGQRYTAEDVLNHPWLAEVHLGTRSVRWWRSIGADRCRGLVDLDLGAELVTNVNIY